MVMNPQALVHPFAPVWDCQSRVLVLGTFPSVLSRKNAFYYSHPQNRFWRVLAALFSAPVPETVAQKRAMLLAHRVALWDVLASCEITGSADSAIRHPVPNDVASILAQAPITAVFANGQTASRLYRLHVRPVTGVEAFALPSTSPANAAWSLSKLIDAWQPVREALLLP